MIGDKDTVSYLRKGSSALLIAALIGCSALASASGSFGPSAGSSVQNPYNMGKRIYHKKVACDTCPLASDSLNKNEAMVVIDQLSTSKEIMNAFTKRERSAVIYYLKKRHKLS